MMARRKGAKKKKAGVTAPASASPEVLAWAAGKTRREKVDGVWTLVPVDDGHRASASRNGNPCCSPCRLKNLAKNLKKVSS
jgi:hypothetical protein